MSRCLGEEAMYVFDREEVANNFTNGDYGEVGLRDRKFFVASWAGFDLDSQTKTAVELVNYFLQDVGEIVIDRNGDFCSRREKIKRECGKTQVLSGVPSVHEVYSVLRERFGYFERGICQKDLVKEVKGALGL